MTFYLPSLQVALYLLIVLEANWYCNSLRFSVSSVRDRSCGADVPWWISRCGVRSERESGKPTLCEPVLQFFTMSQTVPSGKRMKKTSTDLYCTCHSPGFETCDPSELETFYHKLCLFRMALVTPWQTFTELLFQSPLQKEVNQV